MKTVLGILLLGLALAASADTNVTGNWSGSFNVTSPDGGTHEDSAYLVLKQNGQRSREARDPTKAINTPSPRARSTARKSPWKSTKGALTAKVDVGRVK